MFHFLFCTIISVIFSFIKLKVLFHTVNRVAIAIALGDYEGGTGHSQPERVRKREAKINSLCFLCGITRSRLGQLRGWTIYGIVDFGEYC